MSGGGALGAGLRRERAGGGRGRIRRGGAAGLLLAFVAVVLPLTVAPRLVGDAEAAPPPANDNFAAAQVLAPTGGTLTLDSAGATKEVGEPDHAGDAGGASVWFKWTAPATANVSIDTSGSGFDTMLAVYTGASVSTLTLVGSNDDVGATSSYARTCIGAQAGDTYMIAVDGYFGASGAVTLRWARRRTLAPALPSLRGSTMRA